GQHHARMHMFIGQARGGRFEVVETLGAIDPQERLIASPALTQSPRQAKENGMLLATTQVEDVDRFMEVFTTSGAEKRKEHGSKGAVVFRDPSESDRVWAIFDWDEQGWQSFVSDPDVPPILAAAGHRGKLQAAELVGSFGA